MNPQCPICGNYIAISVPKFWTANKEAWELLLVVRHVLKAHPEWVDSEW